MLGPIAGSCLDSLGLVFGSALDCPVPRVLSGVVLAVLSSLAAQTCHAVEGLGTSKDKGPALAYPVRARPSYRSGRRTLVLYSRIRHRTTEFY